MVRTSSTLPVTRCRKIRSKYDQSYIVTGIQLCQWILINYVQNLRLSSPILSFTRININYMLSTSLLHLTWIIITTRIIIVIIIIILLGLSTYIYNIDVFSYIFQNYTNRVRIIYVYIFHTLRRTCKILLIVSIEMMLWLTSAISMSYQQKTALHAAPCAQTVHHAPRLYIIM